MFSMFFSDVRRILQGTHVLVVIFNIVHQNVTNQKNIWLVPKSSTKSAAWKHYKEMNEGKIYLLEKITFFILWRTMIMYASWLYMMYNHVYLIECFILKFYFNNAKHGKKSLMEAFILPFTHICYDNMLSTIIRIQETFHHRKCFFYIASIVMSVTASIHELQCTLLCILE